MKTLNLFFLMMTMLGVVGCIEAGSNEGSTFKEIEPVVINPGDTVSFATLKSSILEPMCLRCHGWAADEAKVATRIVPGNPDSSRLFAVVEDGSMPADGPALTLDQLDIVRQYIIGKGKNPGDGTTNPGDSDGDDDDSGDDDSGVEPLPARVTFSELNEKILTPKCLRCHGDMGSEAGLAQYLTPGRSTTSLLYEVVEDGSMPRRSAPLTEDELLLVRRYIDGL